MTLARAQLSECSPNFSSNKASSERKFSGVQRRGGGDVVKKASPKSMISISLVSHWEIRSEYSYV
jgi:hypothetical protein